MYTAICSNVEPFLPLDFPLEAAPVPPSLSLSPRGVVLGTAKLFVKVRWERNMLLLSVLPTRQKKQSHREGVTPQENSQHTAGKNKKRPAPGLEAGVPLFHKIPKKVISKTGGWEYRDTER